MLGLMGAVAESYIAKRSGETRVRQSEAGAAKAEEAVAMRRMAETGPCNIHVVELNFTKLSLL